MIIILYDALRQSYRITRVMSILSGTGMGAYLPMACSIYAYLGYMETGSLIRRVDSKSLLNKPEKLYFDNPNLFSVLCDNPLEGTIRETFAAAMIGNAGYRLHYPLKGDFLVENRYLFEVGGKNKSFSQIANIPESYVLRDDEEYGVGKSIPLWLLGFLY
jgi:uncharacterized protein